MCFDGMKTMLALKTADNNTFDAHWECLCI